jgi:hypothetical protein
MKIINNLMGKKVLIKNLFRLTPLNSKTTTTIIIINNKIKSN